MTDGIRALLQRTAPATSGRLSDSGFLFAGAAAGTMGWGGTQLLTWIDPPLGPALATAWWAVLIAAFGLLTVLHAPASVRFSDPMFVWGSVNGTAMVVTVGGVVSAVPPRVAFWHAWVLAAGLGYLGTGTLLVRAGARERGLGYLAGSLVACGVVVVAARSFAAVEPVPFLLLGVLHAVPLLVDAAGGWSVSRRTLSVVGAVGVVLALGVLL